jgi:hypothetical protein
MKQSFLPLLLIGALMLGMFWADRRRHARAKRVANAWSCFKCGKELGPLQSVLLPVAGVEAGTTKARFCSSCAEKTQRKNMLVWLLLAAAFITALAALWLTSRA